MEGYTAAAQSATSLSQSAAETRCHDPSCLNLPVRLEYPLTACMQANGVAYTPLTDKTPIPASATAIPTEAATPVDAATRPATNIAAQPKGACACSIDGMSGNTDVGLIGCKQHGLDVGDTSYYCYAQGGKKCAKATASTAYTGVLGSVWHFACT